MQAPAYLLPQPRMARTPELRAASEQLFTAITTGPPGQFVDYHLPFPKWQFLSIIGETHDVVFHGSCDPAIQQVEPRQSQDIKPFSAQRAIYATTDGIWVVFFAILDRRRYPMSLFNMCLRARMAADQLSEPLYYFSITQAALACKPWCEGVVYILPREQFEQEPPQPYSGIEIVLPHWASTMSAMPIAKLRVGPDDFPFLTQIRGHDDQKLVARALADPNGFPWLDSQED
jgi:hypothetical protein